MPPTEISGSFYNFLITHTNNSQYFIFQEITISSDVPFVLDEFEYITGIKQHTKLSALDIKQGLQRLLLKKRFSSIVLEEVTKNQKRHLVVTLVGAYVLKKVTIKGIWFGKAQYAALYNMQPGGIFDVQAHENSLKNLRKKLYHDGFLEAKVHDEIEYNQKEKTINVTLSIKKGSASKIKSCKLLVEDEAEQKKDINAAEIETLIKDLEEKLIKQVHGYRYTQDLIIKLSKKIKSTLAQRGFYSPRIQVKKEKRSKPQRLDLVLLLNLGKRKQIITQGNTVFNDQTIKELLFADDSPDWLFSEDILSQQLKHEYYKKGYWQTKIHVKELNNAGYELIITEGEPTRIFDIDIRLSETGEPELHDAFFTHLRGAIFDKDAVGAALEQLKNYYLAEGFWDFAVVDQDFVKQGKKNQVSLVITINKGQQRLWAGMSIPGFSWLEDDAFFKQFSQQSEQKRKPFDIAWLVQQRTYILEKLHAKGYWYAEVEPELSLISDSLLKSGNTGKKMYVFVKWRIKQGKPVTFDNPIFSGYTKTSYKKLLHYIPIRAGDVWDRKKISLARKRLKQLDVFKTSSVQIPQLATSKDIKPVVVSVVDDDPLEIRLRVGYFFNSSSLLFKNQNTPKLGASFIFKNPTNQADKITATGDWSLFERRAHVDYQQASPFNLPVIGNTAVYASKFIHPVQIQNSGSAYEASLVGISGKISDAFNEHYQWSVAAGNEWAKITRVTGNLNFDARLYKKTVPTFFIKPSVTIDFLDDKINTSKGLLIALECKAAIPEAIGQPFFKTTLEQSVFYPIVGNVILAGRLRIGHIFGSNFRHILPTERFFLGGPNSVRGYEPDALPPLGVEDAIIDGKTEKRYTIQGGSSMLNGNLELRIPVYKAFGVVLFQDVGVLSQSGLFGLTKQWYPGSGFGLRYKTPIGAIRFDIGWKWKRRLKEDQRSYAWYLTLSEAF